MLTFLVIAGALAALKLAFGLGVVGPQSSADGSTPNIYQNKQGAQVVQQARGKYAEASLRGNCYSACTAATGVAPGTALGTTVPFALYNPATSTKLLVVQRISMGLISGTLGAGVVWITSSAAGDAVPTGTAITPRPRNIGGSAGSIAVPLTTATITTNAAKMIDVFCSLTQMVVATTAVNNEVITKDIDGEITIPAGYGIHLCGTTAAGSSPLVVFAVSWEEVTVV